MSLNVSVDADTSLNGALILAVAEERARGRYAHHIAAAAGVHPSELSRWLNGRKTPNREQAIRLASVLQQPVTSLFSDLTSSEAPAGASRGPAKVVAPDQRHDQLYTHN
jgi:transcriptional regulator with XRE-family HTH domain